MGYENHFSTPKFVFTLAMVLVGGMVWAQQPPSAGSSNDANALLGKRWTLTEMEGRKFTAAQPYLEFDRDQKRVSGSGGCNRFSGGVEVEGSALNLSRIVSTRRACLDSELQRVETTFLKLLETSTRFEIEGNTLRLFADNALVLVLQTGDKGPGAAPSLGGTSWQLVKFQSSDETTLTPDDKSKYTITFGTDGRVAARIDCNRGMGSWKSSGPNQLEFGPLALSRAMCPPDSLHDRIAKDWSAVRSYVIKDGHLFLSLMADGGIYEYEPVGESSTEGTQGARLTGTISYRQRIALRPDAVVQVKLLHVSRADAPSVTIAEQEIKPAGRQVNDCLRVALRHSTY
jgi:heat shock protein HslJ